jgi:hypothetical protein
MSASLLLASLFRLFGPDLDQVHLEIERELQRHPGSHCDQALEHQPYMCPERVRWALTAIADREMPGVSAHVHWFGIHERDSIHEDALWRHGHRRGRAGKSEAALSSLCPFHADAHGMSTVGPHGLMYLYNVHRFGVVANCVPWWWLAIPSHSAEAALDRYIELCADRTADDPPHDGWCPSTAAMKRARRYRLRHLPSAVVPMPTEVNRI